MCDPSLSASFRATQEVIAGTEVRSVLGGHNSRDGCVRPGYGARWDKAWRITALQLLMRDVPRQGKNIAFCSKCAGWHGGAVKPPREDTFVNCDEKQHPFDRLENEKKSWTSTRLDIRPVRERPPGEVPHTVRREGTKTAQRSAPSRVWPNRLCRTYACSYGRESTT